MSSATNQTLYSALKARLTAASVIRQDEPLAKKTTLRVGGPADIFVEPASEEDLASVLALCREAGVPWMVLGRGSNLLIRDGGIRGVVISLAHAAFSRIEVQACTLRCGAGAKLKNVSVEARRANLAGFEFLEGIPGTIGGALRMNAGAMGGAMFDLVETFRFMDQEGVVHQLSRAEVSVNYRSCPILKTNVALGAVLRGQAASADVVAEKMKSFSHKRWDSQPAQPSAGCIFKNPSIIPAGKLVDELGLKGMRVGGAMVSDIHGNFIVNESNATARNVLDLIEVVRARVKQERGLDLETEVEIVGED